MHSSRAAFSSLQTQQGFGFSDVVAAAGDVTEKFALVAEGAVVVAERVSGCVVGREEANGRTGCEGGHCGGFDVRDG